MQARRIQEVRKRKGAKHMPTAEKARTIEQAKDWYSKSVGVVFSDYRGMKVKEVQQLRRDLRAKGGEIHVLKNTLFRIAAGDDTANMPADLHNGTTAVTVSTTAITANSVVVFGLKTQAGTAATSGPFMSAVTAGTSFQIKSTAGDTSVYNWVILDLI